MNNLNELKLKFEKTLIPIMSINECKSIWRIWVVKEILNLSLIDFYKKDVMICEKDARQINMLINHLKKK